MKKIDMVDYAEKLFLNNDLKEIDDIIDRQVLQERLDKKRQEEMEDFERERETTKHMQFLQAMLSYFCNVNGRELAKDLFNVQIDNWKKDDAGGYHSDNFQIMQKDLYRFLSKCDDIRRARIVKQVMKIMEEK
jgi:flagellar motor component MotA